jgi:N4-(beta-N-acetylglucosaminyl)-L-asparaginase
VLRRSDHVLIAGEAAAEFARAHGFASENLLTDKARRIWLHWKETLSDRQDWLPPPDNQLHPDVIEFFKIGTPSPSDTVEETRTEAGAAAGVGRFGPDYHRPTGTIHCAGLNHRGEISCTTSTSGLAFKRPGRVGDSPIIGAGLYVDNQVGSCGSTGRGEANLADLGSFAVVELVRNGHSPRDAAGEVLQRIIAHTPPRLLDDQARPTYNLSYYILAADGRHAGVSLWGPTPYAVTDDQGTRLLDCQALFTRDETPR